MPITTALSNFAPARLTTARDCAGCGKKLRQGAIVPVKFDRNSDHIDANFNNVLTTALCPDSIERCWAAYDEKYWNDRIAAKGGK